MESSIESNLENYNYNQETTDYKGYFLHFLKRYFQEVLESLISLVVIKSIVSQKILKTEEFSSIFYLSLLLGFMTYILEDINPLFKTDIKRGVSSAIGGAMIKSIQT